VNKFSTARQNSASGFSQKKISDFVQGEEPRLTYLNQVTVNECLETIGISNISDFYVFNLYLLGKPLQELPFFSLCHGLCTLI
jgi:hypothetical protein